MERLEQLEEFRAKLHKDGFAHNEFRRLMDQYKVKYVDRDMIKISEHQCENYNIVAKLSQKKVYGLCNVCEKVLESHFRR